MCSHFNTYRAVLQKQSEGKSAFPLVCWADHLARDFTQSWLGSGSQYSPQEQRAVNKHWLLLLSQAWVAFVEHRLVSVCGWEKVPPPVSGPPPVDGVRFLHVLFFWAGKESVERSHTHVPPERQQFCTAHPSAALTGRNCPWHSAMAAFCEQRVLCPVHCSSQGQPVWEWVPYALPLVCGSRVWIISCDLHSLFYLITWSVCKMFYKRTLWLAMVEIAQSQSH
jgi:hypothetical protein